MKTFCGRIFIEKTKLVKAGITYPIKLEYYVTVLENKNVKNKYGIEIVKTEYKKENTNIESKEVDNITDDFNEINRVINILRNNEVTPIVLEEILEEVLNKQECVS